MFKHSEFSLTLPLPQTDRNCISKMIKFDKTYVNYPTKRKTQTAFAGNVIVLRML